MASTSPDLYCWVTQDNVCAETTTDSGQISHWHCLNLLYHKDNIAFSHCIWSRLPRIKWVFWSLQLIFEIIHAFHLDKTMNRPRIFFCESSKGIFNCAQKEISLQKRRCIQKKVCQMSKVAIFSNLDICLKTALCPILARPSA